MNQYSSISFEEKLKILYSQEPEMILQEFSRKGECYAAVANKLGFSEATVRKWCRKHNIYLGEKYIGITSISTIREQISITCDLNVAHMTYRNFLYKAW